MEPVIIILCIMAFGLCGIYIKYMTYNSESDNDEKTLIIPPKYEEI